MKKIFSKKLILRMIEEKDLPLIVKWSNSKVATGEYLSMEQYSPDDCLKKFENNYFWNDNSKTFIIELLNGKPIGTIHYWAKPDKKKIVNICVKITSVGFRGKGYGYEAQKILILNLFTRMWCELIEMYTDIDNIIEQGCLAKLGFEFVESLTYRDRDVNRLGVLYRLTIEKFNELIIYRIPE
ncbi:MAG: GNAT family N-acetyltransferase [Desulfobacterales bacterium]|nr:GNAT family N-acetyltransferase [Desulfobacterales bacterium]